VVGVETSTDPELLRARMRVTRSGWQGMSEKERRDARVEFLRLKADRHRREADDLDAEAASVEGGEEGTES
jgi:hypothetical protein